MGVFFIEAVVEGFSLRQSRDQITVAWNWIRILAIVKCQKGNWAKIYQQIVEWKVLFLRRVKSRLKPFRVISAITISFSRQYISHIHFNN